MSASSLTFVEKIDEAPDEIYKIGVDPETFSEIVQHEYVAMAGVIYRRSENAASAAKYVSAEISDITELSSPPLRLPFLRNRSRAI